jgi:hypothetical protein
MTLTVLPDPMHATSVEAGTLPVDQSTAVCQVPSAGPTHVSVQSGSADATPGTANHNAKTSGTAANRIVRLPALRQSLRAARRFTALQTQARPHDESRMFPSILVIGHDRQARSSGGAL